MAQHDYSIGNGTGAAVRTDLNNALSATASQNSGSVEPATTFSYQQWADTSSGLLKIRNGANSAWVIVGDLSAANLGLATLASPTLTGNPKAPTPASGDNTTLIATTAFVKVAADAAAIDQTYVSTAGTAGTAGTITSQGALATLNSVSQSRIDANSVGQSELKYTSASQSAVISGNGYVEIALTGGANTMMHLAGGSTRISVQAHGNQYDSKIGLYNSLGFNVAGYVYSNYIQASPPYNLGDGDIPLFIYALVNKSSGIILGTSSAKDPHWAYHGSHNITPDRISGTGKKYKNVPQFVFDNFDINSAIKSGDDLLRKTALDYLHNKNISEIELTDDYKNQDMNQAAHPFVDDARLISGEAVVVLIDPVSPMVIDLYELHKQTEHSTEMNDHIPSLLHDEYIKLDNSALKRSMPDGVIAVAASWKTTKGK